MWVALRHARQDEEKPYASRREQGVRQSERQRLKESERQRTLSLALYHTWFPSFFAQSEWVRVGSAFRLGCGVKLVV